jgi:membrane protease YdiL (CAAX protease family)
MKFLGPIDLPERSFIPGRTIIVIAFLVLAAAAVTPGESGWTAGFFALLALISAVTGSFQALHLSIFFFAAAAAPLVAPLFRDWPYTLLVPLIVYLLVVLPLPMLRRSLLWTRSGMLARDSLLLVAATAAVAGIALCVWHRALRPDLSRHLGYIPDLPVWTWPFLGLGFSVLNAAMEEAAFRGIVMQAADSAFGPGVLSLLSQAGLFGVMHYLQGFPRGLWGIGMTFLYGVMLGHIRRASQGMLAPWIAHVLADLVIFAILVDALSG